jgi:calcium-dependent protein kinase
MAPEVLSSQVLPASDLWSAGVMAHQLLTGRLPFDDHRNPFAPSISAVWKSVLMDKVAFNMPWWSGISPEAQDFVSTLLQR